MGEAYNLHSAQLILLPSILYELKFKGLQRAATFDLQVSGAYKL